MRQYASKCFGAAGIILLLAAGTAVDNPSGTIIEVAFYGIAALLCIGISGLFWEARNEDRRKSSLTQKSRKNNRRDGGGQERIWVMSAENRSLPESRVDARSGEEPGIHGQTVWEELHN